MKRVAEKLAALARTEVEPIVKDKYGRSSFNRYYYHTYLEVRQLLAEYDEEKSRMAHSSIPIFLTSSFCNEIKKSIKNNNTLSQNEKIKITSRFLTMASKLSNSVKCLYGCRVTADYNATELLIISEGTLQLGQYNSKQVQKEVVEAEKCISDLRRNMKLYGFI